MEVSVQPPKVSKDTLLITTWVLFGAAAAFYVSRLAIRMKFTGRLWIDDLLAGIALAFLLADSLLITVMADAMYETLKLSNLAKGANSGGKGGKGGKAVLPRANVFNTVSLYMKLQFAEIFVFWTCLWLVKASFLAFFYRLTNKLRPYVITWWCIVVFTTLSYVASMVSYPIACSSFNLLTCENERSVHLSLVSLRMTTALDIISDLMIIALPMSLALRVRLPLKTKVALCGIFAFGGLVVIMAIVRIVITNNNIGRRPEMSWLNVWSAVEASTAVIVCNLAVFKFLFRGRSGDYTGAYQYRQKYGVSGKPGSEKILTSQRSGTYGRNSTSVLPTATRPAYHMKRGLQTHVSAIPLTERTQNGWEHGLGEIVVTREFDQMTADELSFYEAEDDKEFQSVHSTKTPSTQHTPQLSHQASFYNPGRANSPTQIPPQNITGRKERRKSDSSNEMFLPSNGTGGKFHFGTIR